MVNFNFNTLKHVAAVAVSVYFLCGSLARASTTPERISDALAAGDAAFIESRYEIAMKEYTQAADLMRKTEKSDRLIGCLVKIARADMQLNNHDAAINALTEAVNVDHSPEYFSADNNRLEAINLLVKEYARKKDTEAIEALIERCFARFRSANGASFDDERLDSWADRTYRSTDMLAALERHWLKDIEFQKQADFPDSVALALDHIGLAGLYHGRKQNADAAKSYKNALRCGGSKYYADHYQSWISKLIECEKMSGHAQEAARLQIVAKNLADMPPTRQGELSQKDCLALNQASRLSYEKKYVEAAKTLQDAESVLRTYLISDDLVVANIDTNLAVVFAKEGRDKDAEMLFEKAVSASDGYIDAGLKDSGRRFQILKPYVQFLQAKGHLDKEKKYAAEIASIETAWKKQSRPNPNMAPQVVTGNVSALIVPSSTTVLLGDKKTFRVQMQNISNPRIRWSVSSSDKGDSATGAGHGTLRAGMQWTGKSSYASSPEVKKDECSFDTSSCPPGDYFIKVDVLAEKGEPPLTTAVAKVTVPKPEIFITPTTVALKRGQKQLFKVVAKNVGDGWQLKWSVQRDKDGTGGVNCEDPQHLAGTLTQLATFTMCADSDMTLSASIVRGFLNQQALAAEAKITNPDKSPRRVR